MSMWRRELVERLALLRLRPEREAELVEELSQHLDDRVRDLVAGGENPAAAQAAALADLDAPGELAADFDVWAEAADLPTGGRHRVGAGSRPLEGRSPLPPIRSADPRRSTRRDRDLD